MKVFERDYKINFVDINNVFVGFDGIQDCCEYFDYTITDKELEECPYKVIHPSAEELKPYVFDTSYRKNVSDSSFERGGMTIFRLVAGDKQLFLHLFNSHNGYYCHGFDFGKDGEVLEEGAL